MNKLKWIAVVLAVVMVLMVYCGAVGMQAELSGAFDQAQQIGKGCVTAAAVLAVVLAWLAAKLEKPLRTLGVSVGAASAAALAALADMHGAAIGQFLLILALVLIILWMVGSMIRRHVTKGEE